jgi:uncharacterized RmlC-like cupin family protein
MASVRRVRPGDRSTLDPKQTPGMHREQAAVGDGSWAGVVRTEPGMVSGWHHHGDYESYIYMVKGTFRMEFGPGGRDAFEAGPDDYIVVPRGAIHRESNPGTEPSFAAVIRVGTGDPVFNVDDPEPLEKGRT